MSKVGDTLRSLFPFLNRKKIDEDEARGSKGRRKDDEEDEEDEEEEDQPIGAISMNEGKHDKIFGIRREVVKGIGAFFAVVLLAALLLAPDSQSEQKAAMGDGFPKAEEKDIAAQKKTDRKDSTNDYGSLIEANRRKAELEAKANGQANQQPEKNPPSQPQQKEVSAPVVSSLPVLPRVTETPTVIPVRQTAQTPAPQPSPQEKEDGRYASSISFSVASGNTQIAGNGSGQASGSQAGSDGSVQAGSTSGSGSSQGAAVVATPTEITPRSLAIGTIIPVRLMTGINTDSPGQVMAMVLSDVTDSLTGNTVLIPVGSKLFGSFGGSLGNTSTGRIPLVFSTVLTPDNRSFQVGNAFQAMDGAGYTGVKGKVDKHTAQRFGSGMLSAGIAALGSLAAGNTNGSSNTYSAGQLASQGALASLINQTTGLLQSGANIGPTTTVKPGYEFSIFVTQSIQF